jgi:WD40 repeat protein
VADPLGGNRRPIAPDVRSFPGWQSPYPSPDGRHVAIAWSARRGGFGGEWISDIAVVELEHGDTTALTDQFPRPFYGARSPSWAPDSRHVAFTLDICPYRGCEPSVRSVVMMDVEVPKPKLAFVAYGGEPQWQPVTSASRSGSP